LTHSDRYARLGAVLWSLRGMALMVIGPAVSVGLGAAVFGLPRNLQIAAVGMFMFSLGLCAILARAEWHRLAPPPEDRSGGKP
jgi:hypothetical protein